MSTNNGNNHEGNASDPDYQHLAEKAVGHQLREEFEAVEDAHQTLWGALVFDDNPRHTGPTDFTVEHLEAALDAVAAYEWFLCNRVAPLLPDDSLDERFYEKWTSPMPVHNRDD